MEGGSLFSKALSGHQDGVPYGSLMTSSSSPTLIFSGFSHPSEVNDYYCPQLTEEDVETEKGQVAHPVPGYPVPQEQM